MTNSQLHPNYHISETRSINPHPSYLDPQSYPNFQADLVNFKSSIKKAVKNHIPTTYYKFGDGDYFFLKKQSLGTTIPGATALLHKDYSQIDLKPYFDGVSKNDYVLVEIQPEKRIMFKELFPKRKIDFPFEFLYALTFNKWFLKEFKGQVGLIGAQEKLDLIRKLLEQKEYQNYLGIDKFNDYIGIPQKGTADDLAKTEADLARKLKKAKSKVFLLGVGHVKSALIHRLKKYHNAVYLDIGVGIDALAGVVDGLRPYAADWVNYRLTDYDYSKVDTQYYLYRPNLAQIKYLINNKPPLLKIAEKREKGGLRKNYNVFEVYDRYLRPYKQQKIKLLEIGAGWGGSLWMYKKYFQDAKITGIDILEESKKWEGKGIKIFIGDQANETFLRKVEQKQGPFDIVIDDGGHTMQQQIVSFQTLFPLLNTNGIYIIEDLNTSYWPDWGGCTNASRPTTINILKSLIDKPNWWAYRYPHAKDQKINSPLDFYEKYIHALHFYDGICVIEKKFHQPPLFYTNGEVTDYNV